MSTQAGKIEARPTTKAFISTLLGGLKGGLNAGSLLLARAAMRVSLLSARCADFSPRPDDIFIVSYPRSGTTWLQMILYQLATDGDMSFPHISKPVPFFERAVNNGRNLDNLPSPRIFKSHLRYGKMPPGSYRRIYVARDGRDVAVSLYHFSKTQFDYRGTFPRFFRAFVRGKVANGSWFAHVQEWWVRRDDPNVLFLRYEELVRDFAGSLRKIIDFCGFDITPERMPVILERCSFEFMKKHELKFNPIAERIWESKAKLTSHIRKGGAGGWRQYLTPEEAESFEREFSGRLGRAGLDLPGRSPAQAATESDEGIAVHHVSR